MDVVWWMMDDGCRCVCKLTCSMYLSLYRVFTANSRMRWLHGMVPIPSSQHPLQCPVPRQQPCPLEPWLRLTGTTLPRRKEDHWCYSRHGRIESFLYVKLWLNLLWLIVFNGCGWMIHHPSSIIHHSSSIIHHPQHHGGRGRRMDIVPWQMISSNSPSRSLSINTVQCCLFFLFFFK